MAEETSTVLTAQTPRYLTKRDNLRAKARAYVRRSKAPRTLRAYQSDWQDFLTFCQLENYAPLPAAPSTVALYLAFLADYAKVSTLQRRIAAISQAHQAAGYDSPTHDLEVRTVMAGIRRTQGTAPRVKTAATTPIMQQLVATLPDTLKGQRDRALLLLGFAGAFRRSELVSLTVTDLQKVTEGFIVTLRFSKSDQEGRGRLIGIPYGNNPATCPVRTLERWLRSAEITQGHLFRAVHRSGRVADKGLSDKSVALIGKKAAEAAGFDPAEFGGHSLRAGLATAAATAGVSERKIMDQTGHRSEAMLRRYIRDGNLFRDNAAGKVGL